MNKLSNSPAARWTALTIVSVTMMFGYFFCDVMSPLEPLLTASKGAENGLGLGWTSSEYGWFSGAYGLINVYLLLLFFGGIILDKFGIRFTGLTSTILMLGGAIIKWWAVCSDFGDTMILVPTIDQTYIEILGRNLNIPILAFAKIQAQVAYAGLGFAIFGVGCEIAGITVSKVIVKWFTGKELALAMGLQVALARIGTALALAASLPLAKAMGGVSASVGLGAACLCIGVIAYLVYNVMDKKEDAASAAESEESEEGFKFADLKILFLNPGFWCITFLCLMFYAGVFPFLKFATKLMVFKYGVDQELAGLIPAMLPFGTIFLTPLFGSIYDKYGKGATLMLAGSILLTIVHVTFALPVNNWVLAIAVMIVLGIAFGLVPSAMWPSVPKIIPEKNLGTAYSLIYWIQNMGMLLVPIFVGGVLKKYVIDAGNHAQEITAAVRAEYIFIGLGIVAVIVSLLLKASSKKNPQLELDLPNKKK